MNNVYGECHAMRIAVFSRYPVDSGHPKGGVESVTVVLVKALAQLDDLNVHIIILERERPKIAIEQDGDITVHRLPGSRWPQILDIFAGPGRKRLLSYIRHLKPVVLHTHETYGLGLGNISIPHVFTIHGFDYANIVADSAKLAWYGLDIMLRPIDLCLNRCKCHSELLLVFGKREGSK